MNKTVRPARAVNGTVVIPGDKSISHRYAMLSAIAEGTSTITNYSTGADCHSTLKCLRALGVQWSEEGTTLRVEGRGIRGLTAPHADLDAGNSGSTIRMLSGILAAQPFRTVIGGDESLSQRPMERIMKPLLQMGARLTARDGKYPPLTIDGEPLQAIEYTLPVPSAQVKSCVLLAGLYADGITVVNEPVATRDHTELALRAFGADVITRKGRISIQGGSTLHSVDLMVPGDLSSASFYLAAACMLPGSKLTVPGVGLNPTRTALIDLLVSMGASIQVPHVEQVGGELIGTLVVGGQEIEGGIVEGATTAAVIDEIPALAVLGAKSRSGLTVRDAGELRVKETDRISTIVDNLRRMGAIVEETPDGFHIPGRQSFRAAQLDSFGDHRIAMAFAVAALAADGECVIENAEAASISYPEFYATIESITE
jgi:3-phosphoshikimate 1-carboxyvinyltransferase